MSEESPELPRVLIADDSRMVRASIIREIRDRFDCREESDGESAWQALLVDSSIELLITDIGMPRLDGYELIERLRGSAISRLKKLPVIVISGDEEDASRERARTLGANDFIRKGIGSAELIARLDSLSQLGRASRELEESREALAQQSPLDPASGLATRSYMQWRGSQDLALARRKPGSTSVMVVEIDDFQALVANRGEVLAERIAKRLRGILASRVRHEDTVSELSRAQFAVLAPLSDMVATCAFALRLQSAIDKLVMTYRSEKIQIGVSVGVASSPEDEAGTLDELIGIAVQRLQAAQAAGGRRVVGNAGEVTRDRLASMLRAAASVDQALARLRLGDGEAVAPQLPQLVAALLPLLSELETRHELGLPLQALAGFAAGSEDAQEPGSRPDSGVEPV